MYLALHGIELGNGGSILDTLRTAIWYSTTPRERHCSHKYGGLRQLGRLGCEIAIALAEESG